MDHQPIGGFDVPRSCVVYTPAPLAAAIVRALGDSQTAQWLEPCVGEGVFIESLAAIGIPKKRIRALDLETTPGQFDSRARTLRGREFLRWSRATRERFSRIVANPPYLAINRLPLEIQAAALEISVPGSGRVPLGANCWLAFLCASLRLLRPGGSLGFLLPAAWQYSDYAAPVRRLLPRMFRHVEVHRSERPLFTTVQEGSVVLVAREFLGAHPLEGPQACQQIEHASGDELIATLRSWKPAPAGTVPHARVLQQPPVPRQGPAVGANAHSGSAQQRASSRTLLREVMEIRLGGVTGDVPFFLLTDEERKARHLPTTAFRPAISRAHHLKSGAVTAAGWEALRSAGERVWLFHPTAKQARKSRIRAYLRLQEENGGCNRNAFKVRCRKPWYRTPLPSRIDGYMSGMSTWGPWVVFRELPRLTATNTLYVITFVSAKTADEKAAWAMWLLTTKAQRRLRAIGRRYADGLLKFEPGDIGRLIVDRPVKTSGAYRAYKRAVKLLLSGKRRESRGIADAWFSSRKRSHSSSSHQPPIHLAFGVLRPESIARGIDVKTDGRRRKQPDWQVLTSEGTGSHLARNQAPFLD